MAEDWRSALFAAVRTALTVPPALWGIEIFPDDAPAGYPRPYVIYGIQGGGEQNLLKADDIRASVLVKAVSEDYQQAMSMAAEIRARLNNKGFQDVAVGYLYGGPNWDICTVTCTSGVMYTENMNNRIQIRHVGDLYDVRMQAK